MARCWISSACPAWRTSRADGRRCGGDLGRDRRTRAGTYQLLLPGQARWAGPARQRLGRLVRPGAHLPSRPARPAAGRMARGMADAAVQSRDGGQVPGADPRRRRCRAGGRRAPRYPAAAGHGGGGRSQGTARHRPGRVRRLAAALDLSMVVHGTSWDPAVAAGGTCQHTAPTSRRQPDQRFPVLAGCPRPSSRGGGTASPQQR